MATDNFLVATLRSKKGTVMTWSSLHRHLGHPPGPVVDEMIDRVISVGLVESGDLDFKKQLPPPKGLASTDFPKDIAAMANSGGGTIVYGVEETDKIATARTDIGEVTEFHERSLRSAAITAISPPIFNLGFHRTESDALHAAVIVVPPSIDGPHLIYRNDFFGAPIRNDADTVWMREPQIEAMYRARFDERRHTAEALANLYTEAARGRDTTVRAWIVLVAHPRRPVTQREALTRDRARELFSVERSRDASTPGTGPFTRSDLPMYSILDRDFDVGWRPTQRTANTPRGNRHGQQSTAMGRSRLVPLSEDTAKAATGVGLGTRLNPVALRPQSRTSWASHELLAITSRLMSTTPESESNGTLMNR